MRCVFSNKDGTFVVHEDAKLLSNDCVACKAGPGDWRIVDYSSGALVKGGLKSYGACEEFMSNLPEKYSARLARFRQSDFYKALTDKVIEALLYGNCR